MRTLNVQPEETKEGKVYSGRKLIKALREHEDYQYIVLQVNVTLLRDGDLCLAECALVDGGSVVATSAVARSVNDLGPDNKSLGTLHVQAAVTVAKKECIMDYFGLVEEYNELPVKSDVQSNKVDIQAGIEKLLNEQNR